MLAEWANRGLNQWTIAQRTQALTSGTRTYALAADVIDILSAVVTRSSTDLSLTRVSRDDDLNIPNKATTGRPTQLFMKKSLSGLWVRIEIGPALQSLLNTLTSGQTNG